MKQLVIAFALALAAISVSGAAPTKLGDACWMWGHDTGVYDGTNNAYKIPVSPKISMPDAIRNMGIPNVCVIRWATPTQFPDYLPQFKSVKRYTWVGGSGYGELVFNYWLMEGGLHTLREEKNLIGFDFDDFFKGKQPDEKVKLPDGTEVMAYPAGCPIVEYANFRTRMKKIRPDAEMRMVLYSDNLRESIKPYLPYFDTILFWTWNGKDVSALEKNFARYRELAPTKPTLLGIYMWDFGGKKPIAMDAMRHQLDFALKMFRKGEVRGFVFHCTPLVNKNLEAVNFCRDWIAAHKDETCSVAAAAQKDKGVGPCSVRVNDDVSCERFPNADAVCVDEVERVAYNPDGTYENVSESWTKILTEKGRREESTVSLGYSKRYGEAAITYVGAVGTNGVERAIDVSKTTKEATDNGSMAMNIYDPLDRQIVCRVPGLQIGETLHVKMRRRTLKPRCAGKWADLSVFEWTHPILRSTYEVTAPKELPLKKIAVRHPLGNVVSSQRKLSDGRLVHTFVCTNSPQAFAEPDMPPLYTQLQNVRVSTAEDWPEISRWYWELSAPHLAKTNAAMVAKVREIVAQSNTSLATLRALFRFVSQEVRYMGLTMEDTSPGYAPHDVDITFNNRYGVCRDKAALLVAMLRLAGFKAYPVLINVGAKLDPEVPQPFFNHAIVAVASTSDLQPSTSNRQPYLLMDPTNENAKDLLPAYEGDMSYLVCRPEGENLALTPVESPEKNAFSVRSKGRLARDGSIVLESDLSFAGINDTAYRSAFVRRKGEERVRFFESALKRLAPGADLIRCDIEPKDLRDTETPLNVRLVARLPECLLAGETRTELNVPLLSRSLGLANFLLAGSTSLITRRFPLVIDSTALVDERLELDLEDAVGKAISLPTASCVSPGCDFTAAYAVTGSVLTASRRFAVSQLTYGTNDYLAVRRNLERVEAAERRRPVFANDTLADADVRVLLDATDVDIVSDRAWTVTNTVVKEILTYAGKKNSAELKLSYHPLVGSVHVVSAVVSNRGGRVAHVTAREINEMDCGWAAAAPRYPAGRTLVVNLPSVEIGSVVSYTVVRTVTNAPSSFYAAFGFDSREPLVRRHVRVNGWARDVVNPRRLPNEPSQPSADLWRDVMIVSSNRFDTCELQIGACDRLEGKSVREIRDWMAKYVKVAGPGVYELPLEAQLTPPEKVLDERYGTRLDYVRTLAALLRGAGYEADVVLAANNADEPPAVRRRDREEKPNVRAFSVPLCRVTEKTGGFLGFGGEERTYYLGTENEYAPLGPSAYDGSDWYDPERGVFGVVTVPTADDVDRTEEETEIVLRENGAADVTVVSRCFGSSVGAFRRLYAEILPEKLSRHYQSLLGDVAQAATATSDLEADFKGYPALRRFSCYVPDYATVEGDAVTLTLPKLLSALPTYAGRTRTTPFAVGAAEAARETVRVRFPEGYVKAEHLPTDFSFADPSDPSRPWLTCRVTTAVRDGALEVTLVREVFKRIESAYPADMIELVRERSRLASSRPNRTLVVRTR